MKKGKVRAKPLVAWFAANGTLKSWHNDFTVKGRARVRSAFIKAAALEIERLEAVVDQLQAVNAKLTKEAA